jgi:serine/threonine protein phosphatase PrpC
MVLRIADARSTALGLGIEPICRRSPSVSSAHALKLTSAAGGTASSPAYQRRPRVEAFGLSHVGRVRRTNEDAYAIGPELGLFGVADGMGGAAAGEVASRLAIDTVRKLVGDPDATLPHGISERPTSAGLPLLVRAVECANALIWATACGDRSKRGMGTTFTGLLMVGDRVAVAHVGDSRAYRFHRHHLEQITDDHTVVAAYVQAGVLKPEEAATSRHAHKITRALGAKEQVDVDSCSVAAEPGDTFLLCSDGLHGVLHDAAIAAVLMVEPDLTRAATRLIEQTNDKGGPDNITVVLVRIA